MQSSVFNNKPKSRMRFESENLVQEATGPFEEVWKMSNQGRIAGSDSIQDSYRFNKKIAKRNLNFIAKNTCVTDKESWTKLASFNQHNLEQQVLK